jgi:hypothetical protein
MNGWGLGVGALESAGCVLGEFERCGGCRGIRLVLGGRGRVYCPSREGRTDAFYNFLPPCTLRLTSIESTHMPI